MADFEMFEDMAEEPGDFSLRCLPRSAAVFRELKNAGRRDLVPREESRWMDEFDAFLLKQLPFLSYVVRAYYRAHEPATLQLRKLADASLLEHFDEAVARYLWSNDQNDYAAAESIYFHVLERALVHSKCGKIE